MTGRPSKFSKRVADLICLRLAEGESLRAICEAEDMPDKATVFRWLFKNEAFRDQYAHAREHQADTFLEKMLAIAETPEIGERVEEGSDHNGAFEKTVRDDMLGHRRLQVDALKWAMARMAPKKYGDKIEQTLQGGDKPVAITKIELVAATASDAPEDSEGSDDDGQPESN